MMLMIVVFTPFSIVLWAVVWILHLTGTPDATDLVYEWIEAQHPATLVTWAAVVWLVIASTLLQVAS